MGLHATLLLLAQEGRGSREFIAIGLGIAVIIGMAIRKSWRNPN